MEIERKWVAEAVPAWVCERTGTRIEQAYLTSERDGPEARIRRRDGHCTLTVKSAGTLERTEVQLAISGTDFDALRPLTNGRQLVKTRVELPALKQSSGRGRHVRRPCSDSGRQVAHDDARSARQLTNH
jgi:CYTH domain-containing protein